MATLEMERAKAAIAVSDVDESDIALLLRVPETWDDIEAELSRHDAGAKSFGREDLLRLTKRP